MPCRASSVGRGLFSTRHPPPALIRTYTHTHTYARAQPAPHAHAHTRARRKVLVVGGVTLEVLVAGANHKRALYNMALTVLITALMLVFVAVLNLTLHRVRGGTRGGGEGGDEGGGRGMEKRALARCRVQQGQGAHMHAPEPLTHSLLRCCAAAGVAAGSHLLHHQNQRSPGGIARWVDVATGGGRGVLACVCFGGGETGRGHDPPPSSFTPAHPPARPPNHCRWCGRWGRQRISPWAPPARATRASAVAGAGWRTW